jgi:outer membrane protein assembly factor BamB
MKKFGLFLLAALTILIPVIANVASAAPTFADPNFRQVWERTDKLVDERNASGAGRGFIFGPSIFTGQENYTEAPGGQRLVQYFDKARLEINNPNGNRNDPNFVTSGLLVKELVLGRQQNGDNEQNFIQGNSSEVQVAGDPNTGSQNQIAPTYKSFSGIATFAGSNPVESKVGQQVNQRIDRAGNVTTISGNTPANVTYTYYEPATKHNVADVFVRYGNTQGLIWNGSSYVNGALFSPNATYIFGYPITDAYWTRAVVGGAEKDVLVQLFERRTLTYTPTNDPNSQVEQGNVGAHYFRWRYQENLGRGTGTPTTPPTTTPPPPTPSNDYSQKRAPYLKSGGIPQGAPGGAGNVISYPTGAPAIDSSPVYDPDAKLAIVGTAGGGVIAVDLSNLSAPVQKWKFQPTGVNFNSPVTLFNGTVYIGGGDGKVYAIKEADGTQVWASSAAGSEVTGQVALDVDSAYFVGGDGKLYAVNLSNGTPKWQSQPGSVNLINSVIIGSDGTLYAAGNDQKVYAYKKDGTQVTTWTPTALDAAITSTPSFGNGRVYVGTNNGTLYALNSNGTIQTQKTFTAGKAIFTQPAVAGGRVYVGTDDGKAYGVDANNVATVQWTFAPAGAPVIRSSLAVVDGFVYFGAEDKNVYQVEANNAANSRILATSSNAFGGNSPVVNSGLVIIPNNAGTLHVIK